MNLLIDSDIVIDVLRRHIAAIDLFQRLGSNSLFLSAISVGEVVHGIHSRVSAGRDEELFRQFLKNVDVVPFDYEVAVLYGALRFRLRRAGNAPVDPDLMIAATALHHDLVLVTRITDHFDRIDVLKRYDWDSPES